jgi:hypothetical protein
MVDIALGRQRAEYARASSYLRITSNPSLASQVTAALGESLDASLDAIEAVLAIHSPDAHRVKSCVHDNQPWPCPTAQACGSSDNA